MANMTTTNCDVGSVALESSDFKDETLAFAAADTIAAGTILARRSVATAVTASAITGTGTGTVTAATVVAGAVPLAGVHTLRCTDAVANGGTFRLEDPNAQIIAAGLKLTAGVGAATVFKVGGLQFTITDGGTDFAVGDTATLTVAADGKLVPFATDGVGGAQVPMAVLTYEVVATGAGNVPVRALVRGTVKKERLIVDAAGDDSTITTKHLEQLRDYGILAISVAELSSLDNQ